MNLFGQKSSLFASAILEKHTKFGQYQFEAPRLVLLQQEQEQTESESFPTVLLNFSVLLQEISKMDHKIWIGNPRIFVENLFQNISYYQSVTRHNLYASHNLTENNVVFLNRQVQNLQKDFHEIIQTLSFTSQNTRQASFQFVAQEVNRILQLYRQEHNLSVQENQIARPLEPDKNVRSSVSDAGHRQKELFQVNASDQKRLHTERESLRLWQEREAGKKTESPIYRVLYTEKQKPRITAEQRLSEIWNHFQKQSILKKTFFVTPAARAFFVYAQGDDLRSLLERSIQTSGRTKIHKILSSFLPPFLAQPINVQAVQQFEDGEISPHNALPFAEKKSWITQKSFEQRSLVFLQNNMFSENGKLMGNTLFSTIYPYYVRQLRQLFSQESHSYQHLGKEPVISRFYGQNRFFFKALAQSVLSSFAEELQRGEKHSSFLKKLQNTSQNISVQVLGKVLQAAGKTSGSERTASTDVSLKTGQPTKRPGELRLAQANDLSGFHLQEVLSAQLFSKIVEQNLIQTMGRGDFKRSQQMEHMLDGALRTDKESVWMFNTPRQALPRDTYLKTVVHPEISVYPEETVHEKNATRIFRDEGRTSGYTEQMEIALQTVYTNLLKQSTMFSQRFLLQKQVRHTMLRSHSPVIRQILSGLHKMTQGKMDAQTKENRLEVLAHRKNFTQKTEPHPVFSRWKQELMQRISYRTGGSFDTLTLYQLRQSWNENNSSFQEISHLFQVGNTIHHILQEALQHAARQGRKNDVPPFYDRTQRLPSVFAKNMFYPVPGRIFEKYGQLAKQSLLSGQRESALYLLPQRKDGEIVPKALSIARDIKIETTLDFQKTFSVSSREAIQNQMVQRREQRNVPAQVERYAEMLAVRMDTQQNVSEPRKSSFAGGSRPERPAMRGQSPAFLQNVQQKQEVLRFLQVIEDSVQSLRISAAQKQRTAAHRAIPISQMERHLEAVQILPSFAVLKQQVQNMQKEKLLQEKTILQRNHSKQESLTSVLERQTILFTGQSQRNAILLKQQKEENLHSTLVQYKDFGDHSMMAMLVQKDVSHHVQQIQKEPVSGKGRFSTLSFLRSFYQRESLFQDSKSSVFLGNGVNMAQRQTMPQHVLFGFMSQQNQNRPMQHNAKISLLSEQQETPVLMPAVSAGRTASQLVNHQKPAVSQQRLPRTGTQTQLHYLKKVQKEQGTHLERQTGTLKKLEQQVKQQQEQISKLLHRQSVPEHKAPDARQLADQVMREIQKQMRLESQRRGRS